MIAGAVLMGLSFFAQAERNAPAITAPPRRILTDSAATANPVRLRFVTPASLELTQMGWMAGDLHLHAGIDGLEIMAGVEDLAHVAADTFVWRLPDPSVGDHVVKLYWADLSHRPVGDSVSSTIRVR
jgi:hypothetical protein